MENIKNLKFGKNFYLRDTLTVAKNLVGQYLVREIDDKSLIMQITEVEAYIGDIDKACHAYNNKKTKRTQVLYQAGGTIYVYLIYGMYYCFNIVTDIEGKACAVLIRGGKPIFELDTLSYFRYQKSYNQLSNYQIKNFANGPGKICNALNIDKSFNGKNVFDSAIYISENKNFDVSKIKRGKRINIDYAEEAVDFLWRFYI